MKFMNAMKKFGSKVAEVTISAKDKALGLLGLGVVGGSVVAPTGAKAATLAESLTTLGTTIKTAIGSIFDAITDVAGTQISLVIFVVALGWLYYVVKKK